MNAIWNLFAAFANLAASLNGLAGVIDGASGRLRQQLGIDGEPANVIDHLPSAVESEHAINGTAKRKTRAGT